MRWINIAVQPENEHHHLAVYAVNDKGELWGWYPAQGGWHKVEDPPEVTS